jgi:hypothetical protein
MNPYEEKQERRRERLEAAADRARAEGASAYNRSHRMMDAIPMGQPVLVGHYSEKSDRRYRDRAWNLLGKSVHANERAAELERRAASVGSGGISSDDPEAVAKLQEKVASLEQLQERMKAGNRIYRSKLSDDDKVKKLMELGLTEENARGGLTPDFCGRIGFPDYALTNNNANIRRIKERIAQLSAPKPQATEPIEGKGFIITEDPDENRILFTFNVKPSKDVCRLMRASGWRWTPSRMAWTRMLNSAGQCSARYVAEQLARLPAYAPTPVDAPAAQPSPPNPTVETDWTAESARAFGT